MVDSNKLKESVSQTTTDTPQSERAAPDSCYSADGLQKLHWDIIDKLSDANLSPKAFLAFRETVDKEFRWLKFLPPPMYRKLDESNVWEHLPGTRMALEVAQFSKVARKKRAERASDGNSQTWIQTGIIVIWHAIRDFFFR